MALILKGTVQDVRDLPAVASSTTDWAYAVSDCGQVFRFNGTYWYPYLITPAGTLTYAAPVQSIIDLPTTDAQYVCRVVLGIHRIMMSDGAGGWTPII